MILGHLLRLSNDYSHASAVKRGRVSSIDASDTRICVQIWPSREVIVAKAYTIIEVQSVGLGAQADQRDLLPIARSLPATHPAGG